MHLFDTHEPYRFRLEHDFGKRAIDRYDGEIAYADRHLGRLFDAVRRLHPHTFVALTADHGEAFGEHGTFYHGSSLHEEQVRVPAIVAGPGINGRRVDGAIRTIDLGVTLLALFLEGRERQLNAVHGLQPMQEGFMLIAFVYCLALIPAWRMTGRAKSKQSHLENP